jgi:hypothetical protein
MKRTVLGLVVSLVVVGAISVGAAAGSNGATLLIHHQVKGCHSWSLNGGKFQVSQIVRLQKGGTLTITNTDVMSHQLIKLTGGPVVMRLINAGVASTGKLKPPYGLGLMPHMNATLKVSFAKVGVYTFTTKEGDDYMPGVKTVGNDNVLKLKVIVA